MKVARLHNRRGGFEILQTGARVQTAVMRLNRGEASGPNQKAHPHSDQVVLVMEGELWRNWRVRNKRWRPASVC